jgi:hypothetical protein
LTNHFRLANREIETQELRPGGKPHRAFYLADSWGWSAIQQSHITQPVEFCFLRIFLGGQPSAVNQSMRFDHGRKIAAATGVHP